MASLPLPAWALAALGLAALAVACGDDPAPDVFLGAGGSPPPGSAYGNPYIPDQGSAGAGAGGAGGSRPNVPLASAPASACAGRLSGDAACGLSLGASALSAVGSLRVAGGALEASFGGRGYRVGLEGGCPPPDALCQPEAEALDTAFAWATLADGGRVAVTADALALFDAGGAELARCELTGSADPSRRRAAFDPADPRHAWVVDGGTTLRERRLVADGGGFRCEAADLSAPGPASLRDVAARPDAGGLWLAVVTTGGAEGSLSQVWRASVAGGALEADQRWPSLPGACAAGGLLSADAVAALPGGGVAVADGACGAVVRLDASLAPLGRDTLPPGDAPRALAATDGGRLLVASAIARPEGPSVGFWLSAPPAPPAP